MIEIIPAVDIIEGKCVRLSRGDFSSKKIYDATPREMVRRFVDSGMPRVHAVDLDGARLGQPMELHALEEMAAVEGAQVEWGGGLKKSAHLQQALEAGARYLVSGSTAATQPELFEKWLDTFGAGTMILGADTRDGKIAVSGWLDTSDATVDDLIRRFLPFGLSQAIVTDISRDGMLGGPSFELYRHLAAEYPGVCVTVSGGISSMDDIRRLADAGQRRVIVGKALYEGHITIEELQHFIATQS